MHVQLWSHFLFTFHTINIPFSTLKNANKAGKHCEIGFPALLACSENVVWKDYFENFLTFLFKSLGR